MKSSFELAMERLNKTAPTVKMTAAKKKQLAELDKKYTAKIAERELFLKGELAKAAEKSDYEGYAQLEKQLVMLPLNFQLIVLEMRLEIPQVNYFLN